MVAAGLLLLVALATMQVVLRYFFGHAQAWVEEVSIAILLWMVWIGATPLWLLRSHLVLDILRERLGARGRLLLDILLDLLMLVVACAVAAASLWTYPTIAPFELSATEWPQAVYYYPITTGACLLALAALASAWMRLSGGRDAR